MNVTKDVEKLEEEGKQINENLVGDGMFIADGAICILWKIAVIESRYLSATEIDEKVNSYLREDGSYFFRGVYGDYQQAYNYVKGNWIVTIARYYLDVKVDCDNCVIVDLWGYIKRRRERRQNDYPD